MRINEKNIPELNYIEIGNRIKMLRGKIQQVDFANLFSLKQQDISKIETAKVRPSLKLLLKISVHFNKSIEWLLTGQYEMSESQINPVFEPKLNYIKDADLISKTAKVLESNTVYSTVLKDIIVAYYEATICLENLAAADKKIDKQEEQILEIKDRLPAAGE